MGLAPYGDPTRFAAFFDGQVLVDEAGPSTSRCSG